MGVRKTNITKPYVNNSWYFHSQNKPQIGVSVFNVEILNSYMVRVRYN